MKIKLLLFATLAIILVSCANDEIIESESKPEARVLSLTASIEKPVDTRLTLEKTPNSILYKWEEGDLIYLCFEQNGTHYTSTTQVTSVSSEGATAHFIVQLPEGMSDESFKLYGYRSGVGNGFSSNSSIVTLPTIPWNYNTLLESQAARLSLWSEAVEINYSGGDVLPPALLTFQHIGAFMTVNLKNVGDEAITDLNQLALRSADGRPWLRNVGEGGATFNVITGNYENPLIGNTLMFYPPQSFNKTIEVDETKSYYAWFVPGQYSLENNINLGTLSGETLASVNAVTGSVKHAIEFVPGNNYMLYAHINKVPSTIGDVTYSYTLTYKTATEF